MGEIRYVDCRVLIHDNSLATYAEAKYGRYVREDASLEDRMILPDELAHRTIERIRSWIETSDQCGRDDLILLGEHLYRLLFHGKIGEEFKSSYELFSRDALENEDLRLRLTLVFYKEADRLATYPWEFLYKPGAGFLAGQKTNLILTRFVPESIVVENLRPELEQLRILVAYSSPPELGTIDADEDVSRIEALTGDDISVQVERDLWRGDLKDAIETFKPHVFHFIGHGEAGRIALFADEKELQLRTLKSDKSMADWCDSETVSDLFSNHRPRLVFLHACRGAASFSRSLESFTSMARELVYRDIPAVIGMQFAIANEDASVFAEAFYRELAKGSPVDEAVSVGRRKLGSLARGGAWADPRFGNPLVYLQASKPMIVARVHEEPEPETQPEAQAMEAHECPSPECYQRIKPGMLSCPKCRTRILRCDKGHPVAADWSHCPYCDTPLRTMRPVASVEPASVSAESSATAVASIRGN